MSRFLAAACAVLAFAAALVVRSPQAWADPKQDIAAKSKEAMSNYDNFEADTARKLLNEALTIAKKNKLDNDPAVAKVHLYLGIVYFAGLNQTDSAKLEFLTAAQIDPKIQIEPAYRRPDLAKLLDDARTEAASTVPVKPDGPVVPDKPEGNNEPAVDCATVMGIKHTAVETAPAGAAATLVAYIGEDVVAARVSIMYRVEGATDFTEAPMAKNGCTYTGTIPKEMVKGKMLHYYVAALTSAGKVVSSSGSSQVPNLMEITAAVVGTDPEVPNDKPPAQPVTPGKKSVFVMIAVGTGGGMVQGSTEILNSEIKCALPLCAAFGPLTLAPELGFMLSPRSSLSLVARIGVPLLADVDGAATLGPAALLRFRHSFGASGTGLGYSLSLGGGIIRDLGDITEGNPAKHINWDTIAIGPLLIGAGLSYTAPLGNTLRFVFDGAATAGIPVVKELGAARLNFGIQLDLTAGLAVAF